MKLYTHKIESTEENKSPFSGSIDIEIPTYVERISLCQTLGISGRDEDTTAALKTAERAYKLVADRVKKVDITVTETKQVINNLSDLSYYKEGADLIGTLSRFVINGIPLGKN